MEIKINPIKKMKDIQGRKKGAFSGFEDIIGKIEIVERFEEGLKDIEGFSHLIVIFLFHLFEERKTIVTPPFNGKNRGVFSTISPSRPNPLGLAVVELLERNGRFFKNQGN